jgi:hypothetical protein
MIDLPIRPDARHGLWVWAAGTAEALFGYRDAERDFDRYLRQLARKKKLLVRRSRLLAVSHALPRFRALMIDANDINELAAKTCCLYGRRRRRAVQAPVPGRRPVHGLDRALLRERADLRLGQELLRPLPRAHRCDGRRPGGARCGRTPARGRGSVRAGGTPTPRPLFREVGLGACPGPGYYRAEKHKQITLFFPTRRGLTNMQPKELPFDKNRRERWPTSLGVAHDPDLTGARQSFGTVCHGSTRIKRTIRP